MSEETLLVLPVEIHHRIFDHLDARTIFRSLASVCTQLYRSVQSYNRLRLELPDNNLRWAIRHIALENVIALYIVDNQEEVPLHLARFESLSKLGQFTRLRSLVLTRVTDDLLDVVLTCIAQLKLNSLGVTLRRQYRLPPETMISRLAQTVQQCDLHSLHLNLCDRWENANYTILVPVAGFLRGLTVHVCTDKQYLVILGSCPHLRTLCISTFRVSQLHEMPWSSPHRCIHRQLLSRTIHYFNMAIEGLRSLLSLAPSLAHLKLTVAEFDISSLNGGGEWEPFLRQELPSLRHFQFCFRFAIPTDDNNDDRRSAYLTDSLEPFIRPYRTPFWLEEKRWHVTCDYVVSSSIIVVYTVAVRTADMETIVRSDTLSEPGHRLLIRCWPNSQSEQFVEEVSVASCS